MAVRARAASLLAVAVLAALTSVVSCSSQVCSTVGGVGGVAVSVDVPSYQPSPGDTMTVCVAGECRTAEARDDGSYVAWNAFTADAPVEVTATLTDVAGARVAGGTTSVTPKAWYPNGPSCPPEVLSASLVLDQHGIQQVSSQVPESNPPSGVPATKPG